MRWIKKAAVVLAVAVLAVLPGFFMMAVMSCLYDNDEEGWL